MTISPESAPAKAPKPVYHEYTYTYSMGTNRNDETRHVGKLMAQSLSSAARTAEGRLSRRIGVNPTLTSVALTNPVFA